MASNYDYESGYRRPTAWARVRDIMGKDNDWHEFMVGMERVADKGFPGSPREVLICAMHHFLHAMNDDERKAAVMAYYEWNKCLDFVERAKEYFGAEIEWLPEHACEKHEFFLVRDGSRVTKIRVRRDYYASGIRLVSEVNLFIGRPMLDKRDGEQSKEDVDREFKEVMGRIFLDGELPQRSA
jgi:hypothetical protein